MSYIIDIENVKIVFNHKKTDLTGTPADFYFFGSDTPRDYTADNSYYFYPVIKANKEMAQIKEAVELYGPLTIKINGKTGGYSVVKDVKNFGSQL